MLTAGGKLDLRSGGPSDDLDSLGSVRRTVYGRVSRERSPDVYRLFDLPDPKTHGEKRDPTTTPVQQLYFLNSPFVRQTAAALAKEAAGGGKADPEAVARVMFRRALLRDPGRDELRLALELTRPTAGTGPPVWESLAQVLLTCNEFLFLN
jgi:hypothetical protein